MIVHVNTKKIYVAVLLVVLVVAAVGSALILTQSKIAIVSTRDEVKDASSIEKMVIDSDNEAAVRRTKSEPVTSVATEATNSYATLATPAQVSALKTMAWIYPGNPACAAFSEYADGRKIDVLKAEFFTISGGYLTLLDTSNTRCNGYSQQNVARLKQYSTEQFVTISSASVNDMESFFANALNPTSEEVTTLVTFVVSNDLTGIELDFEDFSSWSPDAYADYKTFVSILGTALHAKGKKLMIDGPAISNASEENWFLWRYADFVTLPVDHIVVMAYDYQYDYGAGAPVAPFEWLKNVVTWTSSQFPKEKLTIGLPSYGYQGPKGSYRITILTYDQIKLKKGFGTATRDPLSGEMTWRNGNTVFFYQDSQSLEQKRDLVASLGVTSISVWHLGGNQWFR